MGTNSPQRLLQRSIGGHNPSSNPRHRGLAEAVYGASPTYNHGKSRPSWARRVSFLAPERVAHLPLPLYGCHQLPENRSYWYDLDHSSMIVWG